MRSINYLKLCLSYYKTIYFKFVQVKDAEKFKAVDYVQEKLNIVNMTILPNRWRGKRLPEFVIKDLINKAQAKRQAKLEAKERRKKLMASYNNSM